MPRQQTSSLPERSRSNIVLRVGLVCAALLAAGQPAYSQAPQQDTPLTAGAGSAPNPAPDGLRPQITETSPGAETPASPDTLAAALLPRDLSPWGMFLNADWW